MSYDEQIIDQFIAQTVKESDVSTWAESIVNNNGW